MTTTATYNKSAWLGNYPAHWQVLRIKNIFSEIEDRSTSGNEELLSVSHYTGITLKRDSLENEDDFISNAETLEGYKRVAKGDLVINIMLAWNGSLGISPFDGITSPAYCVYRAKENNNPEYFGYLFATNLLKTEFRKKSTGIIDSRLRLYSDKFFSIFSVVPPVEEQTQIVEYIKTQSQKINHFIAKKQQFIALLKEQRQSVINEAVTKGINKKVTLKDSGIKWLGNIPEHWEVRRIKYLFCEIDERSINGDEELLSVSQYTGVSLKKDSLENEDDFISSAESLEGYKKVTKGDLVINIMLAWNGSLGVSTYNGITSPAYCVYRIKDNNLTEYFGLLFSTSLFRGEFRRNSTGIIDSRLRLYSDSFFSIKTIIPPISEQKQIVNHIKTETTAIDTAIAKTEKEIELIKEYKEAMIAEAVMGKVNFNKL
jgi:type I restriction enzyme S subunit